MESNGGRGAAGDAEATCTWTARKMRPSVALGVLGVFLVSILIALLVFDSMTGVRELAIAAVAALIALVPALRARIDYRLTDAALDRRPATPDASKPFTPVFDVADVSHVVPMRHGFKFYLPVETSNPFRTVWRKRLSDAYSGEVHVESADRQRVLSFLSELGITIR